MNENFQWPRVTSAGARMEHSPVHHLRPRRRPNVTMSEESAQYAPGVLADIPASVRRLVKLPEF